RKAAAVIFNDDSLLSATLTLNDGISNTINLDALSCVIINKENFLKIVNFAEVNKKDQMIIDDKNHKTIQAEDINLVRQPSGLSFEIDFVNMDIQESNMELSFDEPIGSESDEYNNTDEETGERLFDNLASSFRKSKEISSCDGIECIPLPSEKEAVSVLQ
ncbi:15606_t:CDS:2, partial [Racocetra persica]